MIRRHSLTHSPIKGGEVARFWSISPETPVQLKQIARVMVENYILVHYL